MLLVLTHRDQSCLASEKRNGSDNPVLQKILQSFIINVKSKILFFEDDFEKRFKIKTLPKKG